MSNCVCPACRIERAFRRALSSRAGADHVFVRDVTDAVTEVAVEHMSEGRYYAACKLLAVAVGLAYYAHRHVMPQPAPERAPRPCEVN